MIKLTSDEITYITMFEKITGATVKDCIINDTEITFIVKKGNIGLAIGKKGIIINKVKTKLGKEIHVYEHSEDPKEFIKNLLYPLKVDEITQNDKTITIRINSNEKKRAIGKGGKKIKNVKELASRHFDIQEIKIL